MQPGSKAYQKFTGEFVPKAVNPNQPPTRSASDIYQAFIEKLIQIEMPEIISQTVTDSSSVIPPETKMGEKASLLDSETSQSFNTTPQESNTGTMNSIKRYASKFFCCDYCCCNRSLDTYIPVDQKASYQKEVSAETITVETSNKETVHISFTPATQVLMKQLDNNFAPSKQTNTVLVQAGAPLTFINQCNNMLYIFKIHLQNNNPSDQFKLLLNETLEDIIATTNALNLRGMGQTSIPEKKQALAIRAEAMRRILNQPRQHFKR